MKPGIFALVAIILASLCYSAISAEKLDSELEIINGLILDRAITRQGHDFYQYFSQAYERPKGIAPATLIIKEIPSARWGSIIWIESDSKVLHTVLIRPGRGDIKEQAEQAAVRVTQALFRFALNGAVENPDLDKDGY